VLRIIAIELTNKCNIKCLHCPQGHLPIEFGFMSEETFRKCLTFTDGYTELNWRGEPTLHPDLVRFAGIAKQSRPNLRLGFHTHGLGLTRETFRELVREGLDWLHVSLHSVQSCEQYKRAREWNQELNSPLFVYADTDTTQEKLIAISAGLSPNEFHHDQNANWAGYLTANRIIQNDPANVWAQCPFPQQSVCIAAWDGSINGCCWDFQGKHRIGHVDELAGLQHSGPYELCPKCIWVRNYEELPA
jgi:hypothetical protein